VFVDIRPDTLNIDETLIEAAIAPRTKAISPIHYAGTPAEMDRINDLAKKHHLLIAEDAAQALGSKYKNRNVGAIGDLAAISFHETKNIISGEGGAQVMSGEELARCRTLRCWARFQFLPVRIAHEVSPQAAHPTRFFGRVMCRRGHGGHFHA
jgi:dTDP-4-amino-4,6-dideoxygalactose transaminase